ncbi:hypothetical protein [Nocardiopsis sp. MG754419]|uniref:hypothetical protein n=1 Tax=Nocardiopsis sp. MG754419 TaxID=2259865 RepID=UPI001BA44E84|nr:hypothetical protein [Nocardiopsis sp. MG754419]MBR8743889.1 hypothetical protein [Nocardiopsis sp. MG754419]
MRVKPRLLIITAMTAAFFGTAPAFASDDSPGHSDDAVPSAPMEEPAFDDGPVGEAEPERGAEADDPGQEEGLPEDWDPDVAGPSEPIEEEPNYTG